MYEYFVHDKKDLHNLDDLGIACKTVSTISPTTQTLKCFDIFVCVSSEDTNKIRAI